MNFNDIRKETLKVKVGNLFIGGDSDLTVQSMTNTDTHNFEATFSQVKELVNAGCDIIRIAISDMKSVDTIYKLKNAGITAPLVADIHYDYKIAVECASAGIDKIRINPGNIGDDSKVYEVVKACKFHDIPIRIGVNSGSLEKNILKKYGSPTPEALVESAVYHMSLLEKYDFYNIIVAIKASNAFDMVAANRIISGKCKYPLHLGVTEAGTSHMGIIKSSVGIGSLLIDGIGDTIRVSLTANPVLEVQEGKSILKALNIGKSKGIDIISCPTCGRTQIDIIKIAEEFEHRINSDVIKYDKNIKVAIMGCAVNGPGEAREADIGIAGGINEAILFKKGVVIRKIAEQDIINELINEVNNL